MTKRRDIVKKLKENGLWSEGGTNHEKFTDGKHTTQVPRHNEIDDVFAKMIYKQAGIK